MDVVSDPHDAVAQLRACTDLAAVKKVLQNADEEWTETFIEAGGLTAILDCLSVLGEREVDSLSDAMPRLDVVSCLKAVLNCRYGLECVIRRGVGGGGGGEGGGGREGSLVGRIALALNTDNMLLKIQLFLVLSAIAKHSREGLSATLSGLDLYKTQFCLRHRYSVLTQELSQSAAFPECQATVMVFVNYLLSSCLDLESRMRLRSELNALDFSDILAIMRYTENEALKRQVQLYEEGLLRDREESAMPGGIDITDHQQLFNALFEKVFGTPNSTKLLSILQKMLLIDRDTPVGDVIWNGLETMSDAALKIYSEQQAERVVTSEMVLLRIALEKEAARKTAQEEERTSGEGEALSEATSTEDPVAPPSAAAPPPPPPPPPFGLARKTVAEIRSIFDKARQYVPSRKMKKVNWEKASDYDAKQRTAVWHGACDDRFRVSFSDTSLSSIETLFCQKMEGTDGKFSAKSKKTHLPNQKKALNVNIVLDGMRKTNPLLIQNKMTHMSNEEVLDIIRRGSASELTLTQATILWEQAPDENDVTFLEPFIEEPSTQEKLGRVEQYMVGLLAMPDHTHRLRVLRNKKVFEDMHTEYQPTFDLLHMAMEELMSSRSLKELLHIILLTGNFINGNTKLGSAYGFKISSLTRLSNTLANVRRTTLNVNFLHFLITVCERDCPRLLKFQTELPHLDAASRISVEAVEEELEEWKKEVDELKEMMTNAKDLQFGEDFISQLQQFLPEADATLSTLLCQLDLVKEKGAELARYFCDGRKDFLECVFLEIKNFSLQFSKTLKETVKENPIVCYLDLVSPGNKAPNTSVTTANANQKTTPTPRPGLSHATSVVTAHVMDLPNSLKTIAEACEERSTSSQISLTSLTMSDQNPFIFPSNGLVRDDSGSPPIVMKVPHVTDIVVTDVEGGEEVVEKTWAKSQMNKEAPAAKGRGSKRVKPSSSSSYYKRHSISSIAPPTLSPISRQSSWNEYKSLSQRHMTPRGAPWGSDCERLLSSPAPQNTIFEGSLEEVAKLLHRMAEAIERDMNT